MPRATLDVSLLAGTLASGDTFDILDFGSVTGEFTSLNLPGPLLPAQYWDTSELYTLGQISVGVSEPSTLVLLALSGLGLAGCVARRRIPGARR